MQEVDPKKLIPGEYYYLENKTDKAMKAKGKFTRYYTDDPRFGGKQAAFRIVLSENIKSKKMNAYLNDERGFPLDSYKFYKPLAQDVINRYEQKDKQLRVEAARRMINSQYPYPEDVISTGNMFSEEPYVTPPTYEQTPQKTNIGNQLANQIGEYLGGKKTDMGGRKSRKTRKSKKSKKSKRSKSRRRR